MRIAVKAEQKCCCVRGLFCLVMNRVPGCDPLTAKTARTGWTALSVLPSEGFTPFLKGSVFDCLI